MKLHFIILKNEFNNLAPYTVGREHLLAPAYFSPASFFEKVSEKNIVEFCSKLDIHSKVETLSIEEVPTEVNADYVYFLDQNSYINSRYILNSIHAIELFNEASLICGPVLSVTDLSEPEWFTLDISKAFYSYILPSLNGLCVDITNELENSPLIENCIFSGKDYNAVGGYYGIPNKRVGFIKQNDVAINNIGKQKRMVYVDMMVTKTVLSQEHFTDEAVGKKFYCKGYSDALKNIAKEKTKVVWEKYIDQPETLDYSSVKWIPFKKELSDDKLKYQYAEKLVMFKGLYNLGFIEGLLNKSII